VTFRKGGRLQMIDFLRRQPEFDFFFICNACLWFRLACYWKYRPRRKWKSEFTTLQLSAVLEFYNQVIRLPLLSHCLHHVPWWCFLLALIYLCICYRLLKFYLDDVRPYIYGHYLNLIQQVSIY